MGGGRETVNVGCGLWVLTTRWVGGCSADELADEVCGVLTDMATGAGGGGDNDDDDGFPLTAVLARVNESRKAHPSARQSRVVARAELETVLIALEEQNKLMYIRDGDDPMVMLI